MDFKLMYSSYSKVPARCQSAAAAAAAGVGLRLLQDNGVAFLEDLVYGNERLECLDLVGEDWLPAMVVSGAPAKRVRAGGCWLVSLSRRTLSCPARRRQSSCGPMCIQYMRAHACLSSQ